MNPPRPVTCVVLNKSESMIVSGDKQRGFSLFDLARHGVKVAHGVCEHHDFSLVAFSSIAALVPVTSIDGLSPGGHTNMSSALNLAYEQMPNDTSVQSTIIILSDGCSEGDAHDPLDIAKHLTKQKPHVRVHTISIGYNARHTLMRDIANVCGGVFRYAYDVSTLRTTMCHTMGNILRGGGPGRQDKSRRETVMFDMFCLCLRTYECNTSAVWVHRLISDLRAAGHARDLVDVSNAMIADLEDQVLQALRHENYNMWGYPYIMMLESSVRNRQRSNFNDKISMMFANECADDYVGEVETLFDSLPPMKLRARTFIKS